MDFGVQPVFEARIDLCVVEDDGLVVILPHGEEQSVVGREGEGNKLIHLRQSLRGGDSHHIVIQQEHGGAVIRDHLAQGDKDGFEHLTRVQRRGDG